MNERVKELLTQNPPNLQVERLAGKFMEQVMQECPDHSIEQQQNIARRYAAKEIVNEREESDKVWGRNTDGSPYVVGVTVAELRQELAHFQDTDEVCMVVCPKKHWNGGGLPGKLKAVERGIDGQVWLKAFVLDESLEG